MISKWIRQKFSKPLYVQLWPNRLRVAVVGSNEVYDEKPLVAIETSRGEEIVKEIGKKAESLSGPSIKIINPFLHPRTLFANFQLGEKMLRHAIFMLHRESYIRPGPVVIVHPMEKCEGGLTQIERRALREMLVGAGAIEVFLHIGAPLIIAGANIERTTANMEKL